MTLPVGAARGGVTTPGEVADNDSVVKVKRYARTAYEWPFAGQVHYGVPTLDERHTPGVLVTQIGAFDLTRGTLPLAEELTTVNKLGELGAQYFIVQTHPEADAWTEIRAQVEANGGAILGGLPVSAAITRLTPAAYSAVRDAVGVMSVVPYHPAFKLNPNIGLLPHSDAQKAMSPVYTLSASVFPGEDVVEVAKLVNAMDMVSVISTSANEIVIEAHRSRLGALASLEPIYSIQESFPFEAHGEETTSAMQVGGAATSSALIKPYHDAGILGDDQLLIVTDSGISIDAADLSDTSSSAGAVGAAHRKVQFYGPTNPFGGSGDGFGCDAPINGSFTHGHLVSATALGNATNVDGAYGTPYELEDPNVDDSFYDADGVAPRARLIAYDAQVTPAVINCSDPNLSAGISPGTIYAGGSTGNLGDGYSKGGRVANFSFGSPGNLYGGSAQQVDDFQEDNLDALTFVSAGNNSLDSDDNTVPDEGTLGNPGTTKNGVSVGASLNLGSLAIRAGFSSVGPAPGGRTVPHIMAPGANGAAGGIASEYGCRSNDNDQGDPVECDLSAGSGGTSFAAPAAAGAALLIRDYFEEGFYPDGTDTNPGNGSDAVDVAGGALSGAAVKAALIASAEHLGVNFNGVIPGGDQVTIRARHNSQQGYGRVQLDRVLPLVSYPGSVSGLVVYDGVASGATNPRDISGLTGTLQISGAGATANGTFDVCDNEQELRIAVVWMDPVTGIANPEFLVNDIDLELRAPGVLTTDPPTYIGNLFSDDINNNRIPEAAEDCGGFDGDPVGDAEIDEGEWSLPVDSCPPGLISEVGAFDPYNDVDNSEAIFLSPDPTGITTAQNPTSALNQIEIGTYTITLRHNGTSSNPAASAQDYAVVISGGVCLGSTVRFDQSQYVCNELADIVVAERPDASDPLNPLDSNDVQGRVTVDVLAFDVCDNDCDNACIEECSGGANDGLACDDNSDCPGGSCIDPTPCSGGGVCGAVVTCDTETGSDLLANGVSFTQPDLAASRFVAEGVTLTSNTAYDPGNGVLDVRDGNQIRVSYQDDDGASPAGDLLRTSSALVNCQVDILSGNVLFGQVGTNTTYDIIGGCEQNARGLQEFDAPDLYMDAGEVVAYNVGFQSAESDDLVNAVAELRCVLADADSTADCQPNSDSCPDPNRINNAPCGAGILSVLDSPKTIGRISSGATLGVNFTVAVNPALATSPTVELLMDLSAPVSGKTGSALVINRHRLNVDEVSTFYSTDFPTGGTQQYDSNNNDLLELRTTDFSGDVRFDYIIENRTFGDLTAGTDSGGSPVAVNGDINAPWDFDSNDGAFRSGLQSGSDVAAIIDLIANWGEDQDFSGAMTGTCNADPQIDCNRFPVDGINCSGLANAQCDEFEDREPAQANSLLDQNWSANGGCGWQTDNTTATCQGGSPEVIGIPCFDNDDCIDPGNPLLQGTCTGGKPPAGGIWHTGTVALRNNPQGVQCVFGTGAVNGDCQQYEVVSGENGENSWWELLLTPVVTKVNKAVDANGDPEARVEITNWAWNQALDLPDNNVILTSEFDTDADSIEPVDLISDGGVLNTIVGAYGAISQAAGVSSSNPELSDGYSVFAQQRQGAPTEEGSTYNGVRGINRDGINSCAFEESAFNNALTYPFTELGLAGPADDDVLNGYCDLGDDPDGPGPLTGTTTRSCSLVCDGDTDVRCNTNAECSGTCGGDSFCTNAPGQACTVNGDCSFGTCADADPICGGSSCIIDGSLTVGDIDQYVTTNGPIRNFDVSNFNGPDMRVFTLEDIFGESGENFQAAVGILTLEGETGNAAVPGYGLAIDDMVMEWREIELGPDASDCATDGTCASIEMETTSFYEGSATVDVTLHDPSPFQMHCDNASSNAGDVCFGGGCIGGTCIQTYNDCDGDGDYVDDAGTPDCGTGAGTGNMIRINARSEVEVAGEDVDLFLTGTPNVFKGAVSISSSFDVDGVLFLTQQGQDFPSITVSYNDLNDGSGRICQNNIDPAKRGLVENTTVVFLTTGSIVVTGFSVTDNGDGDGFADDNETITLAVEISNKTGINLNNVVVRLSTNDPDVDCILDTFASTPSLAVDETQLLSDTFGFRIGNVNRSDVFADDFADFNVSISSDEVQTTITPQQIKLSLDLDFTGGSGLQTYVEDFETGVSGSSFAGTDFELRDIDSIGNLTTSDGPSLAKFDGYRCTYNDPDWVNANDPGRTSCYLNDWNTGASGAAILTPTWRVISTTDGGTAGIARAFSGTRSASYSLDIAGIPDSTTNPFSSMETIEMTDPINLGAGRFCSDTGLSCVTAATCGVGATCDEAIPTLSFKHQVSLGDSRTVNVTIGESADNGIAHLQLADNADNPVGIWQKLAPVQNVYDQQGTNNYFNCKFDPIDDGNTEESFFDPGDPLRNNGPSSTCFPAFSWVHLGSTQGSFDPSSLGNAEGPGLQGAGADPIGTWVESVVPLATFRGRRVRLRFLVTSLELGALGVQTWEQAFAPFNPDPGEDGWFIDDVTVTGSLANAATITIDTNNNLALPDCGNICTTVTADLTADPAALSAPGQAVNLSAATSTADSCLDGVLQYRYWTDGNGDNLGGNAADTLVQDWTDNPNLADAATGTTTYVVDVRCATDEACAATTAVTVNVNCPASGNLGGIFPTVTASSTSQLDFASSNYDFAFGQLAGLSTYTEDASGSGSGSTFNIAPNNPGAGNFFWYLFKSQGGGGSFCNEVSSYSTGGAGESQTPGRDASLP